MKLRAVEETWFPKGPRTQAKKGLRVPIPFVLSFLGPKTLFLGSPDPYIVPIYPYIPLYTLFLWVLGPSGLAITYIANLTSKPIEFGSCPAEEQHT